jgi:hypothetical protein
MLFTESGIVIEINEEQPPKAIWEILLIELGNLI